jgi:hypothetical protein
MAESSVDEQIRIKVGVFEEEVGNELETVLRNHGATDIDIQTQHGILPIIPIVIAASIGIAALAQVIITGRREMQCQQIIDARVTPLEHRIVCNIKNGKIIVLTKDDEKVEIVDVPELLDFTKFGEAIAKGNADVLKALVESAGGKADISKPDGSETEPSM